MEQQGAPADPSGDEVARLNAKVAELETQVSAANAAQETLNAKVAELETQLSVANAAFVACEKINPEGYGVGSETYVKAMKKQRNCFVDVASAL